MLMILPARCEIMCGATARMTLNTPPTLVARTLETSSSGQSGQQVVADEAGIVDEQVDALAAIRNRFDRGRARRVVGDVDFGGGNLQSRTAAGGHHLFRRDCIVAIEERDIRALGGKRLDNGAANAAATACDDGHFAGKPRFREHHRHQPEIEKPPSTTSVWPLIMSASGRHKR